MFDCYLHPSITQKEWASVYEKIKTLINDFPFPLLRKIPKPDNISFRVDIVNNVSFDLYVNKDTDEEKLLFFSDAMTLTENFTTVYFKELNELKEKFKRRAFRLDKSVLWADPTIEDDRIFSFNGWTVGYGGTWWDEGAWCELAMCAIMLLIEQEFPNRAFIRCERSETDWEAVLQFLEGTFDRTFDMPLLFNIESVILILKKDYAKPAEIVARLADIYPQQYYTIIEAGVKYIGFSATQDFCSKALGRNSYGTIGASQIINAWILATKDLEETVKLIGSTYENYWKANYEKSENPKFIAKAALLEDFMQALIDEYILWTPKDRERLLLLPNSINHTKTGDIGDIFDALGLIGGMRIEICPIAATSNELFEAFMYADPANGKKYKQIIDKAIALQAEQLAKVLGQLKEIETLAEEKAPSLPPDEITPLETAEPLLLSYPRHHRAMLKKALKSNPYYFKRATEEPLLLKEIQAFYAKKESNLSELLKGATKESLNTYVERMLIRCKLKIVAPIWEALKNSKNDNFQKALMCLLGLKFRNKTDRALVFLIVHDTDCWKRIGNWYEQELKAVLEK